MDAQARRVRKLRLSSVSESLNYRGAQLIEDALRTASLSGADGARLLLVRALPLGSIAVGNTPAAIIQRIEERWRELASYATHGNSPGAAQARVVYFNDDLEALSSLASCIARNADASAWFWRLVMPGFTQTLSRDEALRAVLWRVLDGSAEPAAGVFALLRNLLRHNVLEPMLNALTLQDGPRLMRAFGWIATSATNRDDSAHAIPTPRITPAAASIIARALDAWGREDPRGTWLARSLFCLERPPLAAHPGLAVRATRWVDRVLAQHASDEASSRLMEALARSRPTNPLRRRITFDASSLVAAEALITRTWESDEPIDKNHAGASTDAAPRHDDRRSRSAADRADIITEPSVQEIQPELHRGPVPAIPHSHGEFSEYAGLFFVAPILERLGIAEWLKIEDAALAWNLPTLVLSDLARRLSVPERDPIRAGLDEGNERPPVRIQELAGDWIRRVRRYARLTAKIGLRSLVCRRGRVAISDTYLEIFFPLETLELRIRRAGLDLDPGWTPWLGRVICFHYIEEDPRDG